MNIDYKKLNSACKKHNIIIKPIEFKNNDY